MSSYIPYFLLGVFNPAETLRDREKREVELAASSEDDDKEGEDSEKKKKKEEVVVKATGSWSVVS